MIVSVRLSGGMVSVPVVKENILTVLVALADGHIIKRHNVKHKVTRLSKPIICVDPAIGAERETWWAWLMRMLFSPIWGRS